MCWDEDSRDGHEHWAEEEDRDNDDDRQCLSTHVHPSANWDPFRIGGLYEIVDGREWVNAILVHWIPRLMQQEGVGMQPRVDNAVDNRVDIPHNTGREVAVVDTVACGSHSYYWHRQHRHV